MQLVDAEVVHPRQSRGLIVLPARRRIDSRVNIGKPALRRIQRQVDGVRVRHQVLDHAPHSRRIYLLVQQIVLANPACVERHYPHAIVLVHRDRLRRGSVPVCIEQLQIHRLRCRRPHLQLQGTRVVIVEVSPLRVAVPRRIANDHAQPSRVRVQVVQRTGVLHARRIRQRTVRTFDEHGKLSPNQSIVVCLLQGRRQR